MTEASPTTEASISSIREADQVEEEQDMDRGNTYKLVVPEDGYEWRKYGHKFIKTIQKYRSYYKCQKNECRVKKRVEWSASKPANLRVVYEGIHTHANYSQGTSSTSVSSNSYNLLTQVFGDQTTSSTTMNDN